MEKGWKHKKSSNKNKFKVGDIVSYSDGFQKFEGKITGDYTDEKFYVGDKYGYQVSGFGDRLKPEQLTLVTKKMAQGGNVDKELIDASAKSIYDKKGMMSLRNTFLQLAQTDEKSGDVETADYRRKVVADYQSKQPRYMAKGGGVGKTINKEKIGDEVYEFLKANGYQLGSISEGASGEIIIEPSTRKTGDKRKDFFDGMQIIRFPDGTYEVSEYMAGPKEDEMYIYKETKSLKTALKELIKGNNRKPIKKYAKGGGVKSSTNTYKLRAEGLNDFLAFLQQGMYFRVKSFTVETTSGPDVVVSFTTDASLSEIKSKLDEVPDSHVMLETIKPINEYTGERNEEYAKGGGVDKIPANLKKRLDNANKIIVNYGGRPITEAEAIRFNIDQMPQSGYNGGFKAFELSKANFADYRYATKKEMQTIGDALIDISRHMSGKDIYAKGGGVGSSSKLKYSLYLDRTVGGNVTTYHIADFAAKGDLSIALESLKEAAPKNYMYYTK